MSLIADLALLHPVLPIIAKYSLVILICLIAFIPVSLISWIITIAFEKVFILLIDNLNNFGNKISEKIVFYKNINKSLFDNFYEKYSSYINYDALNYKFNGHPLQHALDGFEKTLTEAPQIAANEELEKKNLIAQLNSNLSNLSGGVSEVKQINIPELELDKKHERDKKSALSTLILFVPLLIAVIVVNTILLNTFFDEILQGREVLGVPYSIAIALMFTLIEVGIGIVFGFIEKEEIISKESSNLIMRCFGWLVILGLAFIELFIYLFVGMSEYEYDEVYDMLGSYAWGDLLLKGGWMCFIGPIIVLSLYIFGHQVSLAYFKYTQQTDMERFKKELDNKFTMFQAMKNGVSEAAENVKNILKDIKDANVSFNKNKSDPEKMLLNFGNEINAHKKEIDKAISNVEKIEIPMPEIEVVKLSEEETKTLLRTNLIYLILSIATVITLSVIIPSNFILDGKSIDFLGINILLALMFTCLSIMSGIMSSSKVKVFLTSDKEVARIGLEPHSILLKIISFSILGLMIGTCFLIINPSMQIVELVLVAISVICILGSFATGRRFLQAINTWFITFQSLWLNFKILICFVLNICSKLIASILEFVIPLASSLAFPMKFLIGKKS